MHKTEGNFSVDEEFLKKPRGWDASSVQRFMLWIGPTSTVFDILTFIVMFFVIGPAVFRGPFFALSTSEQIGFIALFHAAWFVVSLWTQTLVIHILRTPKIPFIQSRASWPVIFMTGLGLVIGTVLPFTALGQSIGFSALPLSFFAFLLVLCVLYFALVSVMKRVFQHRYGELL
jgi:Mg2+-importing ATPase